MFRVRTTSGWRSIDKDALKETTVTPMVAAALAPANIWWNTSVHDTHHFHTRYNCARLSHRATISSRNARRAVRVQEAIGHPDIPARYESEMSVLDQIRYIYQRGIPDPVHSAIAIEGASMTWFPRPASLHTKYRVSNWSILMIGRRDRVRHTRIMLVCNHRCLDPRNKASMPEFTTHGRSPTV